MLGTDAYRSGPSPHWERFLVVGAAVAVWSSILVARLVYLQVLAHHECARLVHNQSIEYFEVPGLRGEIYDRTGRPLALSIPSETVYVDPRHLPSLDEAVTVLATHLKLDPETLRQRLQRARSVRAGYLRIKRRITAEEAQALRRVNQRSKFPWIHFEPDLIRVYPSGATAAHVVGTVNDQNQGDSGIELALDQELSGRPGERSVLRDARGQTLEVLELSHPVRGQDVGLTIDARIQQVAHEALKRAAEQWQCQRGSVVVMDVASGDVLALASYPEFDPNRRPFPASELHRRENNAVAAPFEPGSVFKVVTIAAALDQGVVSPETPIDCHGGVLMLRGRRIHDVHAYGQLTVENVLAKSSNIGAIQVAMRLTEPKLYEYVVRFGFGRRTRIGLPAESPGRVYPLERWGATSFASVAMGHEVMATTLQLAVAVATVANDGIRPVPRLVLWRGMREGRREQVPILEGPRVIRAETAITMRRMMEQVVLRGTGQAARLMGYTAAGKTGSAQIYDPGARRYTHRYNASFVGFAPVIRPRIVVAVTLNGAPRYGGVVAAPVFREVAQAALQILGVPPDVPVESPPQPPPEQELNDVALASVARPPVDSPSQEPEQAESVAWFGPRTPSFVGQHLRAALAECTRLGVEVELKGYGRVRAQSPEAGAPLLPGTRVRLECSP